MAFVEEAKILGIKGWQRNGRILGRWLGRNGEHMYGMLGIWSVGQNVGGGILIGVRSKKLKIWKFEIIHLNFMKG